MNKIIKQVEFVLENCESVIVPFNCFKEFSFEKDDKVTSDRNYIKFLNCTIKDKNNIEYGSTWSDNTISPIQRLAQYNDITSIYIVTEDDNIEEFSVNWFADGNDNINANQINKLVNYNEIHITIQSDIETLKNKLNDVKLAIKKSFEDKYELEMKIHELEIAI